MDTLWLARVKKIRDARWFSNLTTAIIIFYASVLGFKTLEEAAQPYGNILFILDWIVTLYFIVEIAIKMMAEDRWYHFFKSRWNVFDFVIVAVTLVPLESSSFAAIARLMRVFRILRLFTARPELKAILDMLIKAIPSIVDIVILMFIIFYIYAIIGSFLFADMPSGLWSDFLISMLTLFRILTFEDWTDVMYETMEVYPWSWVFYISFIVIAAFVFFNLFVAVIIGEMQKLQNADADEERHNDHETLQELLNEVRELKAILKEKDKLQ